LLANSKIVIHKNQRSPILPSPKKPLVIEVKKRIARFARIETSFMKFCPKCYIQEVKKSSNKAVKPFR